MDPKTSLPTSLTLLGRLEHDDPQAWSTFTSLYGPLVYSWCRNAGLKPEDIEDAGQEVFRIVSDKLHTFEPGRKSSGAFRSWLWGITRLRILDHFRSAGKHPAGHGGTDNQLHIHNLQVDEEPESIDGVTSRQILLKSAIELLKTQFDAKTWQAFWDMAAKGRPAKEIGEELGMTAKAVRQAKFRVTKKLRETLDGDFPEIAGKLPG